MQKFLLTVAQNVSSTDIENNLLKTIDEGKKGEKY